MPQIGQTLIDLGELEIEFGHRLLAAVGRLRDRRLLSLKSRKAGAKRDDAGAILGEHRQAAQPTPC